MAKQTAGKMPQIRFNGFEGDWKELRFRDVVSNLSGGASIKPEDYQNHGIRTVPKGAVNSTGIADLSGSKYISNDFFVRNHTSQVSVGNLITSLRDLVPSAPNLGRIVKIEGQAEDFLIPQGVYKIELHAGIDETFVISYSNGNKFRKIIASEKNGSTQVHLRNGEFLGIGIPTPSHLEQTQIGGYFRELDRLIELHQRKNDKLVTLKKAMLQKMFPQPGATTPEIRLRGFSGEWKKEQLGAISDSYSGGTPSVGNRAFYGGDISFIRSGEINAISTELTITHLGLRGSAAKLVSAGDILYALYGATSGEVGISQINGAINQAVLAIKPHARYSSQFIATWLRNRKVEILGTYLQGGQGNLSGAIVKSLDVDLPCIEEQRKIGVYFLTLDELISRHTIQLQKLRQIKSACLEKMFV